jgi:hypothetical protein
MAVSPFHVKWALGAVAGGLARGAGGPRNCPLTFLLTVS